MKEERKMRVVEHHLNIYKQRIDTVEGLQGRLQVWQMQPQFVGRHDDAIWPVCYRLVAALRTDSLDEAFRWTNDQSHWERDEDVTLFPVMTGLTSLVARKLIGFRVAHR